MLVFSTYIWSIVKLRVKHSGQSSDETVALYFTCLRFKSSDIFGTFRPDYAARTANKN